VFFFFFFKRAILIPLTNSVLTMISILVSSRVHCAELRTRLPSFHRKDILFHFPGAHTYVIFFFPIFVSYLHLYLFHFLRGVSYRIESSTGHKIITGRLVPHDTHPMHAGEKPTRTPRNSEMNTNCCRTVLEEARQ